MKHFKLVPTLLTLCFAFLFCITQRAEANNDRLTISALRKSKVLMTEISPFVKQQDLGSLTRLQEITKGTLAAIESKGLGHTEVRNEIQQWVLAFLYSRSFFERTMTARTNSYVTELFRLNESLYIDLGFRDHPVSTTTMILLRQLGALLVRSLGSM